MLLHYAPHHNRSKRGCVLSLTMREKSKVLEVSIFEEEECGKGGKGNDRQQSLAKLECYTGSQAGWALD